MRISLSPQRSDASLQVIRGGEDVLIINNELFDFSNLPEGGTIPAGDVPCEWILGPVERIDGELMLTLVLPHGSNPSQSVAFPQPIVDPSVGWEVPLPFDPAPESSTEANQETANVDG